MLNNLTYKDWLLKQLNIIDDVKWLLRKEAYRIGKIRICGPPPIDLFISFIDKNIVKECIVYNDIVFDVCYEEREHHIYGIYLVYYNEELGYGYFYNDPELCISASIDKNKSYIDKIINLDQHLYFGTNSDGIDLYVKNAKLLLC